MLQPDSGDNCCDCPSRTSPCEDCETGACCVDGICAVTSEIGCAGVWLGIGTECVPNPCGEATSGACCRDSGCAIETPASCAIGGGNYRGDGTDCEGNPCPGACCFPDGTCEFLGADDCTDSGGIPRGLGTDCSDEFECCTNCSVFPPIGPSEDICYRVENCSGFSEPVPCDSMWLTVTEYCVGDPPSCNSICIEQTINPATCEVTIIEGSAEACAACVNGTVQTVSDQTFPCPVLSPPP